MMKEMRNLQKADKPKLGEVVNAAVKAVEEAIITTKQALQEKEYREQITRESLGKTYMIPGSPTFFPAAGGRHPLSLTLDLTTKIFEDIGYEIIEGRQNFE